MKGDNVPCEECEVTWDGNPPCDECDKPAELEGMNLACWELWSRLSGMDRPPGFGNIMPIPMTAIGNLCEIYELTIDYFELICLIESKMFGWLVERL